MLENIDVGGPTMIRAAAKNYEFAVVVVRPESYDAVLEELREGDRQLSLNTRESLAGEAFAYTARYDTAIARWFAERREEFPQLLVRAFEKVLDLPYGENPHQRAAYYSQVGARMHVLSMIKQHGGRELTFNNLLDLNAGRLLVREFKVPACAIIKHNNPCGCAMGEGALDAYRRAFAGDPMSAFGGVICLNRPVDRAVAEAILEQFAEVVFAPAYDEEAVELLATKPNLRILEDNERRAMSVAEQDTKRVIGGLLVQDRDLDLEDRSEMQVVTERRPTTHEWEEMLFAWKVCKHVRSNAIVLSKGLATAGIGAGQMGGLGAPGGREGPRGHARGRRPGLGRLLPLPGRPPGGDRRGGDRDHPARRLGARPRRGGGSGPGGDRDGVHPAAPLPPLGASSIS